MPEELHTPPSQGGKKTGRPTKSEAEKLKNVPLRMTAGERAAAEKMAADAGLTLSAYLRERTLGRPLKAVVPPLNREAYADLARLAGNLNQLAHHLNSNPENGVEFLTLRTLVTDLMREVKSLRLELLGVPESEG